MDIRNETNEKHYSKTRHPQQFRPVGGFLPSLLTQLMSTSARRGVWLCCHMEQIHMEKGNWTPIDKSIRRQRELLARRPKSSIESGPLALPSTEILRATERGLKRIDTTEQKIAESVAKLNR